MNTILNNLLAPLTAFFERMGWTKYDAKWGWAQIVSMATLVTTGVFDIPYWSGYLGVPVTSTQIHWVMAASGLVLWLAGKNQSSNLQGSAK